MIEKLNPTKINNRILVSKESPIKYFKPGSVSEFILQWSFEHMYNYAVGTKCKPWENRELDILDGLKTLSFFMTSVSITANLLLFTNIIDLLSV